MKIGDLCRYPIGKSSNDWGLGVVIEIESYISFFSETGRAVWVYHVLEEDGTHGKHDIVLRVLERSS